MSDPLRVHVIGFATAGEALGDRPVDLELPAGSTVADLRRRLEESYPDLAPLWPRVAVAVDGEMAADDTALADGCEVALLPPVSGGAPEAEDVGADDPRPTGLTDGPIDVAAITAAVADRGRGAVVLFLGTVRDHHAGRRVARLAYTAYRPMAATTLRRIVGDLEAAGDDLAAAIVHRLGEVPVGEPSVAIAVASPHRAAAYEASRIALERLKAEAPIWKRERYAGGEEVWREEETLVSRPAASPTAPSGS